MLVVASLPTLGVGAEGTAVATATESAPGRIVIGETMARVRAAGEELGAEVFKTTAETVKQMWKENSSWLRGAMREGKEILDIGTDAARAVRSKFYQAERALIESRSYPTTVVK